jgi:multidrug efflux pump subunit AcrB
MSRPLGTAGKLAHAFIDSKLTPLIIMASVLAGIGAVVLLPREEEPQIIVPMIDVFVGMPGASAKEVETRVTKPMEKLLWEIPGVEYIYSTSSPGGSMAIVRFYVGQDEEQSLVKLWQKLQSNYDRIPPGVSTPLVKRRSIDDVPVLGLTLWSDKYDGFALRRVAANVIAEDIKTVPNAAEVTLIGGQRRQMRVQLDPARLAAHSVSAGLVGKMIQAANQELESGRFAEGNKEALVRAGGFLHTADEIGNVVVGAFQNRPVYVRDVATITDGPEEPANYVTFGTGPSAALKGLGGIPAGTETAAVTVAVAKKKGANAILVADDAIKRVRHLQQTVIPRDINITVTRNYGETATEKSNELLKHMLIAIISVTILVALTLGWRESGVVALAVPVTLGLTLCVFYLSHYTLNRVTLFALIFSIGILVDDAIVIVENIVRHYRMPQNRGRSRTDVAVEAVDEVGNPTILATFAVIAAILPMAFVRGLMGPYMKPIPVGATAAMIFSMFIAFVISPWAAYRLIKGHESSKHGRGEGPEPHDEHGGEAESILTRLYRRVMGPLIHHPTWQIFFLVGVGTLLLLACALVPLKIVKVKMLPFDNKSEFQVIINAPDGTPLEQTEACARAMGRSLATVPEVTDYEVYAGTSGPYNFNGLVRHYFLRTEPYQADIQVNLSPKDDRSAQSHAIARRIRPQLVQIAKQFGVRVAVAEVPPGPPVLQTLVAEIYGPDYERQIEVARQIRSILESTPSVVDVDSYIQTPQTEWQVEVDKAKAALNGIATEDVSQTLAMALHGATVGIAHIPPEKEDVNILCRVPLAKRSSISALGQVRMQGPTGNLVPLSELVTVSERTRDQAIYHKNLVPVMYVTADVAGAEESPVYAILKMKKAIMDLKIPEGYEVLQYSTHIPEDTSKLAMKWDGEWHITIEVFRDLGIAFAAVLVLIYVLVTGWFKSFRTPMTIMTVIPLSLIGILPAHAALGAFFTATSMIGFIAGAGIVVRNSIILVDFIELRVKQGMPLADAVVDAGAVRFRPMLLTAAAVMVGASVILFDPIFQGLAISLMAGEVASLLLSRMAVPVLYYLENRKLEHKTETA